MNQPALETCENCGASIGRLETPHIHDGHVVCPACAARLRSATPEALIADEFTSRMPVKAAPASPAVVAIPPGSGWICCPNPRCGYVGMPKRAPKGSAGVMVVLLLLWIIPGIIYAIIFSGYRITCPRCGVHIRDE